MAVIDSNDGDVNYLKVISQQLGGAVGEFQLFREQLYDLIGTLKIKGINGAPMTIEGTSDRAFGPRLTTITHAANWNPGNQVAYFVYVGTVVSAITPKYVRFVADGTAGTESSVEVGLFSSPLAPNTTGQVLTKLTSGVVATNLTASAVNKNTSAFSTSIPAGTHLWAGLRMVYTVVPTIHGITDDMNTGNALQTTSSAAFSSTSSYSGAALTQNGGATQAPLLTVSLD